MTELKGLVVVRATSIEAPGAALRVAGLSVLERACKQLLRMGHDVLVATDGACPLPAVFPPGVEVVRLAAGQVKTLAADRGSIATVGADVVRPGGRDLPGGLRVVDEPSRRLAEDAIFGELLRGDLGFVARHFNKPISFRLTRYFFCKLPLTPNQVTVGAGLIGLIGAALLASGQPAGLLLGLLLAHFQSVLDGCDGELARVRFQQSAIGEWLDTIVDDALNFTLFGCLGIGLWRAGGSSLDLALGLAASLMLATYNAVAYRELIRQGKGGEVLKIRWWFTRGADLKNLYAQGENKATGPFAFVLMIGRRDFFLLAWLVLAAVGFRRLVLVYAFLVAFANFAVAMGQVLTSSRRRADHQGTADR